jgi:hypothetical protein
MFQNLTVLLAAGDHKSLAAAPNRLELMASSLDRFDASQIQVSEFGSSLGVRKMITPDAR